ncbi:MAG TPA: hypothetical protein VKB69_02665 [Micromonosporaceae bacterium]|nr:hypothetical protein [Micromonosporaceae bacterium]
MESRTEYAVEAAPGWDRPIVTVPAFVVIAAVGGLFPSFSLAANLYVVAVGGVLTWLGVAHRTAKRSSPTRLTRSAAWWLLPAGVFVAVELTDFALGSTYPHPTLSVLVDDPLTHYTVRACAYLTWLGGFWGLVRR